MLNNTEILKVAEVVSQEKGIEMDIVMEALEESFEIIGKSKYGMDNNIKASIDRLTGNISLSHIKDVVEKIDPVLQANQILLDHAKKYDADTEIGKQITIPLPSVNFGRVTANMARQVIYSRVREAEKRRQFNDFKDRVGEVLSGIVKRIEFGNIMNLELNFTAQNLAKAIKDHKIRGVYETSPCFASMIVHYEPDEIKFNDLKKELFSLIESLGPTDEIEINSRIFSFPTVYLDKWTQECIEDYSNKIAKKKPDPELITELNNLESTDQFIRVHSSTEYWVAAIGFWPGLPFMMALDPRCKLTVPKYNPPRTWTPKGTVGMGGASTCIYPDRLPGGYQIFGIIPVPIWDTNKSFPVFENNICLFQPGDRVKFIPTSYEEFDHVYNKIEDGSYDYNIVEYQKFSVKNYKQWLSTIDASKRF